MKKSAQSTFPESGNGKVTARVESVRRFRQLNKRVDYYPIPNSVAAIEWLRERNPKLTTRELIDFLVEQGYKSISGNSG